MQSGEESSSSVRQQLETSQSKIPIQPVYCMYCVHISTPSVSSGISGTGYSNICCISNSESEAYKSLSTCTLVEQG